MSYMAALCIYFVREVVHDFGTSGDERDTVAIFGEQPSGQWPIQKEEKFGKRRTILRRGCPSPWTISQPWWKYLSLVLRNRNMEVITYQQLPRLVLRLAMTSFRAIVELDPVCLKPLWWLCEQSVFGQCDLKALVGAWRHPPTRLHACWLGKN